MANEKTNTTIFSPPVVAVLGHVDHGKTTLLDSIRKTSVASREHGGITQKIGASSVEVLHEGKKKRITFIDTPGHEAFAKMRSRGAQAANICLLIVSSVDGVMPQTKESIEILKAAKLPFIVVLTKSDDPNKNPEKVKQQLIKENVLLEGYGGDVPVIEVSARDGTNVKELLDLILLVMEMRGEDKFLEQAFKGIVIESRLDQRSGPRATVVIKNGTLKTRDEIVCEDITGKVKTMIDTSGKNTDRATVGDAVEVMGFEKVPQVGGTVTKRIGKETNETPQAQSASQNVGEFTLDKVIDDTISLILVADSQGALEAIQEALPQKAKVLIAKTGEVSTADVLFAKSVKGIILSFGIKIKPDVLRLAQTEKVLVRNYEIIYEMLNEVKDVLEGKRLALIEEIYGKAKILANFPFDKQTVLGVSVLEGRIAKGDKVRLVRGDEVIGDSSITSVRQGKNQVSKVEAGAEAGVLLSRALDFTIGDMLLCHG